MPKIGRENGLGGVFWEFCAWEEIIEWTKYNMMGTNMARYREVCFKVVDMEVNIRMESVRKMRFLTRLYFCVSIFALEGGIVNGWILTIRG